MNQVPNLVPSYIDITKLDADIKAHNDIAPIRNRVKSLLESLDDTNTLLGKDIYTNCLAFYRSLKAASRANAPGSTSIYEDLSKQFPGQPLSDDPKLTEKD
jgi:hypothetical protein